MRSIALGLLLLLYSMSREAVATTTTITNSGGALCGGHLVDPKGVLRTPNFPGPFAVPIKCRWIIDVSDVPSTNSSIVVYLTQLYVYKGLRFTEYAYYESETVNFGAALIEEVTEGNVFEHRRFRTFRPFLVVEFELDRLEGNHVRVLKDLLDVHGFNMTYEMTEEEPNAESCTVRDCSFAGNCLVSADYASFRCDCFDGFSGASCNEGSLCYDDQRRAVCQNGATCRQIGTEAMHCDCPDGYVGRTCETRLLDTVDPECTAENCILQCPFDTQERQPCTCRDSTRIYSSRSRYECRIKLSNVTSLLAGPISQHGSLESLVSKQLAKYLRSSNVTSTEELKILSVTPAAEVTFHFFGNSDDGDKIRESLNRLVQRRRLSEIALESTHFTFQQKPALRLQSLRINRANDYEVHLAERMVLSCVAQGSYGINFTWYKDAMLVNASKATREMRISYSPNDGSDVYTSFLTIEKATLLDAGQYTCQVVDWGVQQCKSMYVEVKDEPDVKVVPMSATVEKGSDIQLTCTTPNVRNIDIGFGWTKNRALLKLEPGRAVWEDLYPAGSILKISNAQKSAIYTCNVAHKWTSVRVEVTNRTFLPICFKDRSWGLHWPDTAAGSEALLECPRYFIGQRVSRLCSMKDATTPEWQIPDFSLCFYNKLLPPYDNFRSLTLGYDNTTGSAIILAFWQILRERALPLYPGEGDRIANMLAEIERYRRHAVTGHLANAYVSAEAFTRIIDRVLSDEYSILSQEKLWLLLQLTQRNLIDWSKERKHAYKHLSLSCMVVDIEPLQPSNWDDGIAYSLRIPSTDYTYPDWYEDKVAVRLWRKKRERKETVTEEGSFNGIVIAYKNMSRFIPTTYVKELDDGSDLEFRINSRVMTVAVPWFGNGQHHPGGMRIDLQMRHTRNETSLWRTSCGLLDNAGSWDLDTCTANALPGDVTTHCSCPTTGTVAVFLTARAAKVVLAKTEGARFIVIFGCGSCLVQCLFSALILGSFWWQHRNWLNFLKLQCCGALIGAMAIFVYAVRHDLPESSYSLVAIGLEAFLLVGMSAPISEALIIYVELAQIRPIQHVQPTVMAVITGVPILAVFATELTHKSTGLRHESWWLIRGSGVYNIFVSCATMMFLVFMVLYMAVLHKVHTLIEENVTKREAVENRIRILHRAAVVICGIIAMETSSIFYINSSSVVFHYMFASLSFGLGFAVIMAYIANAEVAIIAPILRKIRWRKHSGGSHERTTTSQPPVKVCSSKGGDAEMDNDSATPPPPPPLSSLEVRGVAVGSTDARQFLPECSSSAYVKPSSVPAASARFLPEIRIDRTNDIDLENYSTSPRKYQEPAAFAVHASRCINETNDQLPLVVESASAAKVLCSADVESRLAAMPDVTLAVTNDVEMLSAELNDHSVRPMPDIANTSERKQPDGEEKTPEIMITGCDTTTTVMLDRISHDLDYLLNRTQHAKEGA